MTESDTSKPTKDCPWCGETILAVARKCKHCGEYLGAEGSVPDASDGTYSPWQETSESPFHAVTTRQLFSMSAPETKRYKAHRADAEERELPIVQPTEADELVNETDHDRVRREAREQLDLERRTGEIVPDPHERAPLPSARSRGGSYSGGIGRRSKISAVGTQTGAGLACPRCGGTQFTAKRSKKGKLLGFSTLGVGGLIAPKSQVKCVACGLMFKRG